MTDKPTDQPTNRPTNQRMDMRGKREATLTYTNTKLAFPLLTVKIKKLHIFTSIFEETFFYEIKQNNLLILDH